MFIIIGILVLGIILNFVMSNYPKIYMLVLGIYSVITLAGIIIANQLRLQRIEDRRNDIDEVFKILDKIFKKKSEEIDYNNVPFTILYDKTDRKKIASIKIEIDDPNLFNDYNLTDSVNRLNQFFQYFQWLQKVDFPKRECIFIGKKKPPGMAVFNGSDLRPWNWIPLGIGSNGEVGWNLGASSSNMGQSMFRFEDTGQLAGTTDVSKAPQCLTLGSTGGGKAIFIDEEITIRTN